MRKNTDLAMYFGLGGGLMYFLDPNRGARRRAGLKNKLTHFRHQATHAADITARDLAHRAVGSFAEIKSALFSDPDASDEILVQRVRSKLGRIVSHPHSIHVSAQDGRVTLSGLILSNEIEELLASLSGLRGVHGIDNRLEVHKPDEKHPALQGGTPRQGERIDLLQTSWAPATRFLVAGASTSSLIYGVRRKDAIGTLLGGLSSAFLLRAFSNLEMKRLFGIGHRRAITIHKSINMNAPVEEVFRFWSDFTNFPRFMTGVREVKVKLDGRSHWTVEGPAGIPISWDAVTTRVFPNQLLAWKSLPGSIIQNAGRVQFHSNEKGGTRVDVDFSYQPPAGALGHVAASVFGGGPKNRLEEALFQMKTLIEEGPSERQVAGLH